MRRFLSTRKSGTQPELECWSLGAFEPSSNPYCWGSKVGKHHSCNKLSPFPEAKTTVAMRQLPGDGKKIRLQLPCTVLPIDIHFPLVEFFLFPASSFCVRSFSLPFLFFLGKAGVDRKEWDKLHFAAPSAKIFKNERGV